MDPGEKRGPGTGTRTAHACQSCRQLKIRCITNDNRSSPFCENCEKTGKECIFTPLVKTRRRKRADARVTELENEVRVLASLLAQGDDGNHTKVFPPTPTDRVPAQNDDVAIAGIVSSRGHQTSSFSLQPSSLVPSKTVSMSNSPFTNSLTNTGQSGESLPTQSQSDIGNSSPLTDTKQQDVIGRGLLSWTEALQLFWRYQYELAPYYPIVPLNDYTDPEELRREKPVLFLAAITAAAANSSEQLRDALHEETLQTYAVCVMIRGMKSLELLQAMLITIAWYRPCNTYNDTKYLQYTQATSLMAHELSREQQPRDGGSDVDFSSSQSQGTASVYIQPLHIDSVECSRTLLAAYVQSSSKYLLSHIPMAPPDSEQVTACLRVLEDSSNTSTYDKNVAAWARLQLLTQEARGACGKVRISDSHMSLSLAAFENQLKVIMHNKTPSPMDACLQITFHACILHLNEIALHEDYNPQDFHPPYALGHRLPKAAFERGATYLNAIVKCLTSAHEMFETLLAMERSKLSSMPSIIFVRTTYAAVVVFKIFLLVTSADHPLAAVLDQDRLSLPYYLEKLRELFVDMSYNLSFHGATKFLDIILRIMSTYEAHLSNLQFGVYRSTDCEIDLQAAAPSIREPLSTQSLTNHYWSSQPLSSILAVTKPPGVSLGTQPTGEQIDSFEFQGMDNLISGNLAIGSWSS